ncbi:uncharacterized protein F4812DRAFT_204116 [Daldinia caldariorum]|uniref:uncharacterized protein n=1 Tax=Daldinia caldariorum TaxID=326644 RepID=UPI0020085FD1|nr:uncharacterized protein F4812DRAFT_204116 [Daldinia caldariorum]KAI1472069.1 hypothetical protein F4812DRAFT_204116 [Daldinia caldariorum]
MEDTEDTTAAMAQAMGFSSFGAQNNSNKRRKYNPRADDAVVASTSTSIAFHEAKSGSNAIPLGVRRKNQDEIDLEDEEEAGNKDSRRQDDLKGEDDGEPEPQYLDTSRPPDTASASPLNNTLPYTSINATPGNYSGHAQSLGASGSGGFANQSAGHSRYQARQSYGREPGKAWWDDYYDPSSNTNPWEPLENVMGLGPRGSWMSWEEAKR